MIIFLGVYLSEVGELFQVLIDRVHRGVDLISLSFQIDGHLRITGKTNITSQSRALIESVI